MVPAAVKDQTDAIDVRERNPAAKSPKLSSECNRVAPTVLTIDPDNSVLEHVNPGSGDDRTPARSPRHPGIAALPGVLSTDSPVAPASASRCRAGWL